MKIRATGAALMLALSLSACMTAGSGITDIGRITDPAQRESAIAALQAAAPQPVDGNGGTYMSPFTTDGVTAEWVTKSLSIQTTGDIAGTVGQIAGDQLLGSIPFAGLFAGQATKALARQAALKSIGGEAFVKSSSDLSFNSLEDMAAYMYAYHSTHPEYTRIVRAVSAIYPDFAAAYAIYPATPVKPLETVAAAAS